MKKTLFLSGLGAIALLASCTQSEPVQKALADATGISFTSAVATKGAEQTQEALNANGATMTVWAHYSPEGTPGPNDEHAYFTEKGYVLNREGGLWKYPATVQDIPAWKAGTFTFRAIAGTVEEAGLADAQWTGFQNDVHEFADFKVKEKIQDQKDIVYAYKVEQGAPHLVPGGNDAVALNFKHILSQVYVMVQNNAQTYDYDIVGVRIGNVKEGGTVQLGTQVNDELVQWNTAAAATKSYSIEEVANKKITLNKQSGEFGLNKPVSVMKFDATEVGGAMLVPQSLETWDKTGAGTGAYIGLKLQMRVAGQADILYPADPNRPERYAWVAVPIPYNSPVANPTSIVWDQNTKYIYTINLSNGAGFVAPGEKDNGGDGTDGGSDDKNPGDPIVVTQTIDFAQVTVVGWNDATTDIAG